MTLVATRLAPKERATVGETPASCTLSQTSADAATPRAFRSPRVPQPRVRADELVRVLSRAQIQLDVDGARPIAAWPNALVRGQIAGRRNALGRTAPPGSLAVVERDVAPLLQSRAASPDSKKPA